MNPLLKGREVAYYLGDSGAKVMFAWHEAAVEAAKGAAGTGAQVLEVDEPDLDALLAGLAPAPSMADRADDDDAVILYTSGNHRHAQGRRAHAREPDPQRRAHGRHDAERRARRRDHGLPAAVPRLRPDLRPERDDRRRRHTDLAAQVRRRQGPGDHRAGQGDDLRGGADDVRRDAASPGPAAADTSSLRTCISGGASMPLEIMRGFEQTFGCMILEAYGLSETSPVASFNHPDRVRKPGSIGTPMEGVEMRVVDAEGAACPTARSARSPSGGTTS